MWIMRVALYCPHMDDAPPRDAGIHTKEDHWFIQPDLTTQIRPTVYRLSTGSLCAVERTVSALLCSAQTVFSTSAMHFF